MSPHLAQRRLCEAAIKWERAHQGIFLGMHVSAVDERTSLCIAASQYAMAVWTEKPIKAKRTHAIATPRDHDEWLERVMKPKRKTYHGAWHDPKSCSVCNAKRNSARK